MSTRNIVIAVVVFLLLVAHANAPDDTTETRPVGTAGSVPAGSSSSGSSPSSGESLCKAEVKSMLKAPSTADFSDIKTTGSSGHWQVTGSVDAENSFGAPIRSVFICTTIGSTATASLL